MQIKHFMSVWYPSKSANPIRDRLQDKMATNQNPKKRKLLPPDEDDVPAQKKQRSDTKDGGDNLNKKPMMTREAFLTHAKDTIAVCQDITFPVQTKRNSTDSVGWHACHHDVIHLPNDKKVAVVMSLHATVIGSKQWKDGEPQPNKDEDIKSDTNKNKNDNKQVNASSDVMSKAEFLSVAKQLQLEVLETKITLKPKQTKQGSVGWSASGLKIAKEVNGVALKLQTTINVTVKKSKEWKEVNENKNEDAKDNKTKHAIQ
eukprot:338657_1